ncbi:oxidase ustYa family protein [Aspergillus stella-maris]|uniref:oxidase ustYa family protein n=1 Tax=Aspergillus stella-maris TaxID=1810926 RepID=UPI003CCC9A7D
MFSRDNAKNHHFSNGDEEANGLLSREKQNAHEEESGGSHYSLSWGHYALYIVFGVSVLLNIVWLWEAVQHSKDIRIPSPLFSPANRILQYKTQTFFSGFGDEKTAYMGPPSDTYDRAWEDLYNYGIIKIPQSDAAQLVNHTMPHPSDPGQYVVELDVFHQLHCLHHLHKKAWGFDMGLNTSNADEVSSFWEHLDHCSESLRQSLMCSSDVSTIHWAWSDKHQKWQADGRVQHTCRDFSRIRGWAFERTAGAVDFAKWVEDPLQESQR